MNEQEFAELAAGHALHALSPDDEARYLEALAERPEWESVALADAAAVASLADGVADAVPPLTMRSNLLARIAHLPQEAVVVADAPAVAPVVDAEVPDADATRVVPVVEAEAPDADATRVVPAVAAEPPVADVTVVVPAVDAEDAAAEPDTADASPETTDTDTDTATASPETTDTDPLDRLLREGTTGRPTDAMPLSADALTVVFAPGAVPPPGTGRDEPVPTTTTTQAIVRRSWTRALLALAACMALLVGIGLGAGALYNWLNRPAALVALEQIESAPDAQSVTVTEEGLSATAYWSEQVGEAVVVSEGLPAITEDETFELWLIRDDEPISAGTFAAEGATATAAVEGEIQPGDVIAITVEPAGGAPGGIPTGDPIVAVPTA
ncbi:MULTISPECIES: anti-sigma factor [unclassified Microbacterium]|uniref:anti-sigma factor n=1 Tax=unclassified Microbacterium TaxID=2609290 RepID=UPI00214C71FC|nr:MULTISPECIES: anti-sigma factor [unclassified Microbacterium]MCR2784035.1 anti-sigma factor [Microbacterium sp. zg.B96]WIM15125.1 anti-sigma factor [Microbacterium sp. zg-B96]